MLDQTFRDVLKKYIRDYLEFMQYWKKEGSPKAQQVLKYTDAYNFLYGLAVGDVEGFASGFFQGSYSRRPDREEFDEIEEIIEQNYKYMRIILSKTGL